MGAMLVLLPLLAQAGAASALPGFGSPYASSLPLEIIEKKEAEAQRRARDAQVVQLPSRAPHAGCMAAADADPAKSADLAREALGDAIGRERVRANFCLGVALADQDRMAEARTAFVAARDAVDADDHASRARLGAMAGNAALGQGDPAGALTLLAPAALDARQAEDTQLTASIALDRARALVATGQPVQAGTALAEARAADPQNAQAWLLSATLSRRLKNLTEAQQQIEKAVALDPRDPEIGLEAGVIAVLSGNDEAARKSWNSVVSTAPSSDAATTARSYLSQLAPQDAAAKGKP